MLYIVFHGHTGTAMCGRVKSECNSIQKHTAEHGSLCKHMKSCLILGAVFIASSMWLGFRIQSNSYLNWEPRRYPIQRRNSENDSDSLYNAENSIEQGIPALMACTGIVTGRTLAIRETVDLKPLNFIAERPEEDVSALPHSSLT